MSIYLFIYIIGLCNLAFAYFEQQLIRRVYNYENFAMDEDMTNTSPQKCPDDLLHYIHNDTYVNQICFYKDVFYNVQVVLGENVTNQTIFEMAIDLSSPWTWYKSNSCKSCKEVDPLEFDFDDKCKRSSKNQCFSENFTKSYNATRWNDKRIKGQIYSEDTLLQGKFQTDTIQLLAYNSSAKMSLTQFLEYEWGNQTPPSLARLTGLQMLQVDYLNVDMPILADGSIGLGFGYTETTEEKAQSDTDFVEKLVKEQTKLNLTRQQFALYTYDNKNFSELVMQFGGFDYKYIYKRQQDIKWLNRLDGSAYYWMVELDNVKFMNFQKKDIINKELPIKKAILTLSSQFIELPYVLLVELIKSLTMLHSDTKCMLVDSEVHILYCEKLHFKADEENHMYSYLLTFQFGEQIIEIDNFSLIYRKCEASSSDSTLQNCFFNIKASRSDYVILGEPFMKNHYIIFENQPGNNVRRIGIMPTALREYIPENPDYYEWPLFKAILLIFIFGLLSICSVTFFKALCKDIFRALKYRRTMNLEDNQSLRVSKDIDMVEYSTQDDLEQKIEEQNQKTTEEWQKSQEQFNFGQKFTNSIEQNSL